MVNIQQFGTATVGSVLNEQATYHLPGNVRFNIDFFKQSLPEVFLQVCAFYFYLNFVFQTNIFTVWKNKF